jgi:hypothetical protein
MLDIRKSGFLYKKLSKQHALFMSLLWRLWSVICQQGSKTCAIYCVFTIMSEIAYSRITGCASIISDVHTISWSHLFDSSFFSAHMYSCDQFFVRAMGFLETDMEELQSCQIIEPLLSKKLWKTIAILPEVPNGCRAFKLDLKPMPARPDSSHSLFLFFLRSWYVFAAPPYPLEATGIWWRPPERHAFTCEYPWKEMRGEAERTDKN